MSACIELARRLGKAIADSPQAAAFRAAGNELRADADLTGTLRQYGRQADKIARLEDEQKPVEVDDKNRLHELHAKLVSAPLFKKFTAAQVEYVDLRRKVNDAIRAELAETERAGEQGL